MQIQVIDHQQPQQISFEKLIRSLARINTHPALVLSAYLDTQWRDEQQLERLRLFWREQEERLLSALPIFTEKEVRMSLQQDMAKIRAETEALATHQQATRAAGVAYFLCSQTGLSMQIPLPVAVENALYLGSRPELRPLLQFAQDHQSSWVLLLDQRFGKLYHYNFGTLEEVQCFRGDSPDDSDLPLFQDTALCREDHLQRHLRWHYDRHYRSAINVVRTLFSPTEDDFLLLGSLPEQRSRIETLLPEPLRRRLIYVPGLTWRMPFSMLETRISEAVKQRRQEQREQEEGFENLFGVAAVREAVNQGRIQRLFVDENLILWGKHCPRCDSLHSIRVLSCPYCSTDTEPVDLLRELTHQVLAQHGSVSFIGERLRAYGGVAAQR